MPATGGQPPFDHRRIPESQDDVDSGTSHVGCLVIMAALIVVSMLVFLVEGLA